MDRVIVTGANGFLGRKLISTLLEQNIKVAAIDLDFDKTMINDERIDCINCYEKDLIEIEKTLMKYNAYDAFFHLAWKGTSGPSRTDYITQLDNIKMACSYVKLAKKVNCKRFIYASSINEMETYEYLQSDNIEPTGGYIYGTAKLTAHLMGEVVAFQENIGFIPVIITNIYGAGEKSPRLINSSIRKLLKKEYCSFTEGLQIYDFIYITDAINSIIEVAKKGKAFNRYYIGSGNPKPLREFLIEMKNVVDPTAEFGLGDLPFHGVDISYNQFNLKKVYEDTGYVNEISFKDGIRKTMDYIRKES